MIRTFLLSALIVLTVNFNLSGQEVDTTDNKSILVLFSLAPTTPAYRVLLDGIRQKLTEEFGDSYILHIEYLESEHYPEGQFPKENLELYNSKYADIDLDLSLNGQTTVIGLKLDAGKTISEALRIFPKTTSVYFISGSSSVDQIYYRMSEVEAKKLTNPIKTNFLINMSMDEIIRAVHSVPDNSLIFVSGFNRDKENIPYYNTEAVRLISGSANAPVFTYTDMGFGDGAFGGKMYYDCLLDWRELKQWNLQSLENKTRGSTVMFKEVTFFGKYKLLIIAGIIFLVLQSFLIARLYKLNSKQKKMAHQINETNKLFNVITNEDRLLRMGMLTASLSHELNQPLTAILSTSQAGKIILESQKPDLEILKEILDNIAEDDKRAASILKSIRGLMKLEKREKEKVNLNDLISEVTDLYHSKAIELKSVINLSLEDMPVYVMADAIQIQQVMLNLIVNASYAMEKGAEGFNIITIAEVIDKDYVTVSVRDFGNGIDESVRINLFKPFITSRKDGTGIGLAISRLIIEEHEGKIWAENKPDGGAEFSFNLKVCNG